MSKIMNFTNLPQSRPNISDPSLIRPLTLNVKPRSSDKLWLDKNENCDPELKKITKKILLQLSDESIFSYPDLAPLYKKLATRLNVNPEQIIFGAGSDGIIRAVFEGFISPGDRVVHTEPTFAMYSVYSKIFGANTRTVNYNPSAFGPSLTVDMIIEVIREHQPKLVCLPNPDSPTGCVFTSEEIKQILCETVNVGAIMLIDEAYYPFYSESSLNLIEIFPNLIVTRSTGKAWGLAGVRIGYGITSLNIAHILLKVRSMYEIGSLSASMFNLMLDHEHDMELSVQRLMDGKAFFLNSMEDLGLRTLNGHGNFLHVEFGKHAEKVHDALSSLVYYRKNFNEPCLKGFSRFSSATTNQYYPIVERIREVIL